MGRFISVLGAIGLLGLVGCGDDDSLIVIDRDAATGGDARVAFDAGPQVDSGVNDDGGLIADGSPALDGMLGDGSVVEDGAVVGDAGPVDGGPSADGSSGDSGPQDAGPVDAGPGDAGTVDAGPPPPMCGNGTIEDPPETCDDGNAVGGDGCNSVCGIQFGYSCTGEPSVCTATCGDGQAAGGSREPCDDGDTDDGDGCSSSCTVEAGWSCTGNDPSVCNECGDGTLGGTEECDDGNNTNGDGCSSACLAESGYDCSSGTCDAICGDGQLAGDEECDDGAAVSGDGCSDSCDVESGFSCTGEPSNCVAASVAELNGIGAMFDGSYDGSLASMSCVPLAFLSTGADVVGRVIIETGLLHNRVGDLVIKVVSPTGTVVTLLSRPGFAESADDGAGGVAGDDSDLVSSHPIRFIDGAANDAETMGGTLTSIEDICRQDARCDYDPNNGAGPGPMGLADFIGETAVGAWSVCFGDANTGVAGTIDRIAITIERTTI